MIHWTLAAVRLWPSQTARVPSRTVSLSWRREGVVGAQFPGMVQLTELLRPLRALGQQAPIVGRAGRVHQVEVGGGRSVYIDRAAPRVADGDDRGDAHEEVGVGLALGVHAGKAVDEAGD